MITITFPADADSFFTAAAFAAQTGAALSMSGEIVTVTIPAIDATAIGAGLDLTTDLNDMPGGNAVMVIKSA